VETAAQARQQMLSTIVQENLRFVWRLLRRLGVAPALVDDAVQHVFLITADRIADIKPGYERSWVVGTAIRVAMQTRRESKRREFSTDEELDARAAPGPTPDEALDGKQARVLLDKVLDGMPDDLRSVFVLFELEEMSGSEIAGVLDLAPGTVASRLRRAREAFRSGVKRLEWKRGQER
jgi:RNA polymerase sigma-70 factor, ECF subfamily